MVKKKRKKYTKENEDERVEEELNSPWEQNKTSSSKVNQKVSAEKKKNVKRKRKKCTKENEDESEEDEDFKDCLPGELFKTKGGLAVLCVLPVLGTHGLH